MQLRPPRAPGSLPEGSTPQGYEVGTCFGSTPQYSVYAKPFSRQGVVARSHLKCKRSSRGSRHNYGTELVHNLIDAPASSLRSSLARVMIFAPVRSWPSPVAT